MNGTIGPYGAPGGFNGSVGIVGQLVDNAAQVKAHLDQLNEQSATGLVSQTYGGLGALSKVSLDLRPQIARAETWQQNITAATTKLDTTSNVLDQLNKIATTFYTGLTGVAAQTTTGVASLANQAQSAIAQVQALLNTRLGSRYLLAGADSGNPPVPNASLNAYVQGVQAAASGLTPTSGAATAAATLTAAQTLSPFSTTIGTSPGQVPVDDGASVQVGIVAGQNVAGAQTGASTTGSYVRDLLRGLATIAGFSSGSLALGQGFTDLVADTRTSLQGAMTAISADTAALGNTSQQLKMYQSGVTAQQASLTKQVSTVENVDAAATISALTQAQTQLSESYKLIAMAHSLSLVSYL